MNNSMTILHSGKQYRMTKSYDVVDGEIIKSKVKLPYTFLIGETLWVENIEEVHVVVKHYARNEHALLIRARCKHEQQFVFRRAISGNGDILSEVALQWVMIDFDAVQVPGVDRNSLEAIEWIICNRLPSEFHDATYCYQWSASAGLVYNNQPVKPGTNVHLFFWMDKALDRVGLTNWLGEMQFDDGWEHDISVFPAVQPLFIINKVRKSKSIIDLIPRGEKIGIVRKDANTVTVPDIVEIRQRETPKRTATALSQPNDAKDAITKKLYQIGCVSRQSTGYIKLFHAGEKTQGDYFVYTDSPYYVHHQVKPKMLVWDWVEQYWGQKFEAERPRWARQEVKRSYNMLGSKEERLKRVNARAASYNNN